MSFDALRTEPEFMRQGNNPPLNVTDYPNDEIIELMYETMIVDVEIDLRDALDLSIEDTTSLDTIIENAEKKKVIQKAFAAKQLFYFYQEISGDEGSGTFRNMANYDNTYKSLKKYFPRLAVESGKVVSIEKVKVTR